jgi:hypothetical protein
MKRTLTPVYEVPNVDSVAPGSGALNWQIVASTDLCDGIRASVGSLGLSLQATKQ